MPVPSDTPSASPTPLPQGDGVLTIGTLFPTTGATAFLAKSQDAGVELAVREINEAGGVNGEPVVVYHQDSGDASTEKAEESFADLVSKGVDVVIGPSSSVLAERLLPKVISAGVAMISSSATSSTLTALDDNGLLFRTVPAEGVQGKALAGILGTNNVAVIYSADDSGRAVKDALASEMEKRIGDVVAEESFSASTKDVAPLVAKVVAAKPDVVVLTSPFSAMDQNKAIILALAKAGLAGSKLWLTSQNLADYSQALPEGTLKGVNGILEGVSADADFNKRVKSADPTVSDFRYAAEAYDATILAALAAIVAGNDSGVAVSRSLREVSAGGIKCTSFGECLDVLTTRTDIDYDGVSGPLAFTGEGDLVGAQYGIYTYGANNKFSFADTVRVD